jgi:hypothetical protein
VQLLEGDAGEHRLISPVDGRYRAARYRDAASRRDLERMSKALVKTRRSSRGALGLGIGTYRGQR